MKEIIRKIGRIPKRIKEDIIIISQLKNWRTFLWTKLKRKNIAAVVLKNGITIESPPANDLNFLFHEIWVDKVYTPRSYKIKQGDIIIDIGGNIGMFAIFAVTRARNIKVYSFEPFPSNAMYFIKNTRDTRLSGIKLQEKAVAGTLGKRFLGISDSWGGHILSSQKKDINQSIEVETITLNEILTEIGRCNFLKIDCEGSEYEIFFSTAKDNLKKIQKIVGEYHDNAQGTGADLKVFLENNSFRVDIFQKLDEISGIICATNLDYDEKGIL